MEAIRKWLPRLAYLVLATFVATMITRTLRSDAPDVPRTKEKLATLRTAGPQKSNGFVKLFIPDADAAAPGEKAAPGAAGVSTTAPAIAAAPGVITGHGIVEPADREVKIGAQVPGIVQKIFVKEGEVVKAGAPIVELLSDAERASLEASKAEVEAAMARSGLSAAVAARVERLAKSGASTTDEQDRAVFQAAADKAAVKLAQARQIEARARLDRLTVRAPAEGTILQLIVREGEYYNPGSGGSIATLGDLRKIRVRMDVDERQIGQLSVGQAGYVTALAYTDRKFPGRVVEIAGRMGRKNQRTDEPTERIDTKVREVVLELEGGQELVQGLRVLGFLEAKTPKS